MLMRPGAGGGTAGVPDPDVFVIGDAATIEGQPLPATAQVANQQAKYVAARLNALVRGRLPAAADADGAGAEAEAGACAGTPTSATAPASASSPYARQPGATVAMLDM